MATSMGGQNLGNTPNPLYRRNLRTAKLLAELARDLSGPDPYRNVKLTARERDVLTKIAGGCTYKEIAGQLGISDKTVATYRERSWCVTRCNTT